MKLNGEKKINLRLVKGADKLLDIDPATIPTLIPKKSLAEIQDGDTDPYYKIQEIAYPIKANGYTYVESFFESFIKKLKKRPAPGSKTGHETSWGARPSTDLYLVGGKLNKNGDGTGTVLFKNYIPPVGDNGSPNDRFIQDNKIGIVDYSLVAYTKDERVENADGEVEYNVIESRFGERNDAVEYGVGAMEQKTNAVDDQSLVSASAAKARRLINAGDYEATARWSFSASDGNKLLGEDGDDWANFGSWHLVRDSEFDEETKNGWAYPYGKNGKVYRSALNAIAQRAGQQGLDRVVTAAQNLRDLIDEKEEKNNSIGEGMKKNEVLESLKTLKVNGEITLAEAAGAMGLEGQIVTDKHTNAVLVVDELHKVINSDDLVVAVKAMKGQIEDGEKETVSAKLTNAFGAEKLQNGDENLLRSYAARLTDGVKANELDAKIEEIKVDPVAKKLAGENADVTKHNHVVGDGKKKTSDAPGVLDY